MARGVTVSAGHTDATYDQALQAVADGVRHVTHAFNAMRPLGHREPGLLGAALVTPELRCELIADNVHVHPAAMRLLVQAKGAEGVVLVSDALQATGLPEGAYTVGGRPAFFMDGAIRLADGTLAGSVLTLDRALHNLQAATGRPLAELWPAASRNAAQAIGVDDRKGSLEPGKDADLVLLDPSLRVVVTVAEGAVVHGGRPPAPPAGTRRPRPTRLTTGRPSSKEEGPMSSSLRHRVTAALALAVRPGPRGGGLRGLVRGQRPGQHRVRPPHPHHLADGGKRPARGGRGRQRRVEEGPPQRHRQGRAPAVEQHHHQARRRLRRLQPAGRGRAGQHPGLQVRRRRRAPGPDRPAGASSRTTRPGSSR